MYAIELADVSKCYLKDKEKIWALKSLSLKFEKGKFYAIMGNSGAGKSTLLQCIGLLDTLTSGKVFIKGKDSSILNDKELSDIRKNNLGFVFQSFYLNPNMKAYENIMLPMFLNKMAKESRKNSAIDLLDKVGLKERYNHYPKELSGGEQQRVAIARSLVNNPDIILADEPTGNLDQNNEKRIFEILKELSNNGKCVIVVSHNDNIKKYADIVYQMKQGEIYETER